jgi:CubicO group peptidase (beta-lactamase class C family)
VIRTIRVWCLLLALGAFARAAAAAEFSPADRAALEAAVRAELEGMGGAALTVAVHHRGREWSAAHGLADIEAGRPATTSTLFRLASITKTVTAVATLRAHEAGKLDLDADLRRYVPEFPPKPWPVTARQVLGHLSGITSYGSIKEGQNQRVLDTRGALALFAHRPLVAAPEMEFVYSTWAYTLLAAALENITGQPFPAVLREWVFEPARMATAGLDMASTRTPEQAAGYRLLRSGERVRSRPLDVSDRFAGGGGRASVQDVRSLGVALLEHRLLKPATSAMMQTPGRTRDGRLTDYGLGLAGYPQRGHYLTAHSGGQPETTGLLIVLPADGTVIALLSNLEGQATRLRKLSIRILEALLEGGQVRRDAYAPAAADAVQHEGLYRLFSYGLAYHGWSTRGPGRPPPSSEDARRRAFARVRGLLSRVEAEADPEAALARIRRAHEPRGGRAFIIAGVHMAQALEAAHGRERLLRYNAEGPLVFARDFLALPGGPRALGPDATAAVGRLLPAWQAAQVEALRHARLQDLEDPDAVWPALERTLNLPLRLELRAEIEAVIQRLQAADRPQDAARWEERLARLHPQGEGVTPGDTPPSPEVPAP